MDNLFWEKIESFITDFEDFIKKIKENYKIEVIPKVIINSESGGYHNPKYNCEKKIIVINRGFLVFLWNVIYFNYFQAEAFFENGLIVDDQLDYNNPIVERAVDLYLESLKAKEIFTDFNYIYPNPCDNSEFTSFEKEIIDISNVLMLISLNYVLFHEFFHGFAEHCAVFKEISKEEKKKLEFEADYFARNCMVSGEKDNKTILNNSLGLIFAHIAMLFSVKSPIGIIQEAHPDIDERLIYTLKNLPIKKQEDKNYIYSIVATALHSFIKMCGINLDIESNQKEDSNIIDEFVELIKEIKIYLSSKSK